MQAEEILTQARTEESLPQDWTVFPLQRQKVALGLAGWLFGAVLGLGLFSIAMAAAIPNFSRGWIAIVFTLLILGILLFTGLGSLYLLIIDVIRLLRPDNHIIVITPEHFVQQQGNKIRMVPLANIKHVTARGVPPPERDPYAEENRADVQSIPTINENVAAFFGGQRMSRAGRRFRRRRTPTSLAFVDSRTDKEIVILTDNSHGDPFTIAVVLKEYVEPFQTMTK
jgi:hypothetical protein